MNPQGAGSGQPPSGAQGAAPPALPSFNQIAASASTRPMLGGPPFQPRPGMPPQMAPMGSFPQYGMPQSRPMPPGPGPKPPQYPDYPSSTRPMQPPQQSNGPQPRPGYPGIPPPGQQGPPGAPRIMLPQPRAAGPYAATYPQQSHLGPDYYARPPSQQAATPSWADRPYPQVSGPPAAQPQPPSAMQQQQHPPTPSHQPPQPQQSQQLLQPASHLPAPNNSTITQPLASPQSSIKPTTPLAEASRGTETATPLPREQVARVEPLQPVESSVEASQPSPIESDDNRMKTRKRARETESAGAGFLSGRSKDGETGSGAKAGQKRRRGDYIPVRNDPRLENIPDDVEVVDFGILLYMPPTAESHALAGIKLHPLPRTISSQLYSIVRVAVPAELLTIKGPAIRRKCLWGTEIYTDDSDPLAVAIHSSWYRPPDAPSVVIPEKLLQLTEEFEAQSKRATPTASTKETLDAGATELVASKDTVDTQENDAAAADAGKTNHGSLVLPRDTAGAPETTAGNEVGIDSKGTSGPGTSHKAGERASLDADGWKPPLPRIPISGSLDPVTRVADHDLLITIRILPQLIRYRGSLRSGLISRGWGIGHDGNSIQVIACEKIPTGDAMRLVKHGMRKVVPTFAANRDDSDGYLMIMESDVSVAQGDVRTFLSYSPPTLNLWPPFLLRIMYQQVDNVNPPPLPTDPIQLERLRKWEEEWKSLIGDWEGVRLAEMWQRDWRCWRVRLCGKQQTCLLESILPVELGAQSDKPTIHVYSLKLANAAPQALTNNSDRYDLVNLSTSHVVASNLRPDEIFFEDEGLIIRKRQTGAPMPENGHLDIVNDVDEEGGAKKVAVTGPVEVPTVIPVFRVRWA